LSEKTFNIASKRISRYNEYHRDILKWKIKRFFNSFLENVMKQNGFLEVY
jgi:Fe-S cluster biosynthesis and repair protein YggX